MAWLASFTVLKDYPAATWGGKSLIDLHVLIAAHPSLREVREGSQAGAEAGTTEERSSLACFRGLHSLLSHTSQNDLARGSTAHGELGAFTSTRKRPHRLAYSLVEMFLYLKLLLPE